MSKRRNLISSIPYAVLALAAFAAFAAGLSDYGRLQAIADQDRIELARARTTLQQVRFESDGTVSDADRWRYESAMSTSRLQTESLRMVESGKGNTYPFMGGGAAAFLLFGFLAIRTATRRT